MAKPLAPIRTNTRWNCTAGNRQRSSLPNRFDWQWPRAETLLRSYRRADIRCFGNLRRTQGDRLVQWTRHYAREYLHAMRRENGTIDWREAKLQSSENRPTLPKFYRRSPWPRNHRVFL